MKRLIFYFHPSSSGCTGSWGSAIESGSGQRRSGGLSELCQNQHVLLGQSAQAVLQAEKVSHQTPSGSTRKLSMRNDLCINSFMMRCFVICRDRATTRTWSSSTSTVATSARISGRNASNTTDSSDAHRCGRCLGPSLASSAADHRSGNGRFRQIASIFLLFCCSSFDFFLFFFQLRLATRAAHKRRLSTLSERIMSNASRFKGKKMFLNNEWMKSCRMF